MPKSNWTPRFPRTCREAFGNECRFEPRANRWERAVGWSVAACCALVAVMSLLGWIK